MRSKFKFTAYLLAIGCLVLTISPVMMLSDMESKSGFSFGLFISILFFGFVWVWIVLGELRTKTISINFEGDKVLVRRFFGLSVVKAYEISKVSGFKTSVLSSQGRSYEYLYLMVGDRKIAKLSAFYHSNYKDLKRYVVSKGIKNIGFEPFSNLQELKDVFIF
jgi:hypothetical protein